MSYHDISQKYEKNIITVRQQADTAQLEIEKINVQLSFNLELSTQLEAERGDYCPPHKSARREEKCEDEPCQQQELLHEDHR